MNRRIGTFAILFALIAVFTVGCGNAPVTANVDATVEARVQATLAANGKPLAPPPMKASTETPLLVSPITTPEVSGVQPTAKQVSDKDGMTLLYVPAGEFTMGFSTEPPVRAVYMDAFWIDQTEVTNAMYAKCVKAGACQAPFSARSSTRVSYYGNPQFDNYPVIYVTLNDAKQYCTWVDRDLPTDAQWEKAARGTDGRTYPWGNDAPDKMRLNYHAYNGEVGDTTPVGAYPTGASPYGALDMAGNVWEWVTDWGGSCSPSSNPTGPSSGNTSHGLRGGSWIDEASISIRVWSNLDYRDEDGGFRCARSTPPPVVPTTTPEVSGAQPTAKQVSDKDGMTLLYVPAGEFKMGAADSDSQANPDDKQSCAPTAKRCSTEDFDSQANPDEKPQHIVYLDAFYIDQTEVTNGMYARCVKAGTCQAPSSTGSHTRASYYGNPQFDNYPVVNVTWNDAKQYCKWAGGDLPTEAQWEKAARGTDGRRIYPWGNQAPDKTRLNYNLEVGDTTPVGAYPTGASPYGALDMAGNVYEWVADWLGKNYCAPPTPDRNPTGPTSGDVRVLRGGSWFNVAPNVRASIRSRSSLSPVSRGVYYGFRCAR